MPRKTLPAPPAVPRTLYKIFPSHAPLFIQLFRLDLYGYLIRILLLDFSHTSTLGLHKIALLDFICRGDIIFIDIDHDIIVLSLDLPMGTRMAVRQADRVPLEAEPAVS